MRDHKIHIFSDKVQEETKEHDWFSPGDIEPVDLNGGFVAFDKTKSASNLKSTQDNINWRFNLEPANDFEEGVKE